MIGLSRSAKRVFKTVWFARAARKALIGDDELCVAIRQVMLGQCDDLGGGVFKKRLSQNRARSIVLAKGRRFWVYEYLFLKKDRQNIEPDELVSFRTLAKSYEFLTDRQVEELIRGGNWKEICNGDES